LPKYYTFENLLNSVDEELKKHELSDFYKCKCKPSNYEDVNYEILNNKDGKYAYRPLQLMHPAIYVSLVHKITKQKNWTSIQDRFKKFQECENIECMSIPRQSMTDESDKAEQVSHWWEQLEQQSIELALDYSYLSYTDITDCYGSMYTHSVPWALHGKNCAKKNRYNNDLFGNQIDNHLRDMNHGQTNGIPQGSTLMDFIAEMVLGYADLELEKRLKHESLTGYKILRYRDDYRIFSNSPVTNEIIIKCLSKVMIDLGFKLNPEKSGHSTNIIKGAIKPDKLYWMQQKQTDQNLQKHLLIIHDLSLIFPNCGSLDKALNNFYRSIKKGTIEKYTFFKQNKIDEIESQEIWDILKKKNVLDKTGKINTEFTVSQADINLWLDEKTEDVQLHALEVLQQAQTYANMLRKCAIPLLSITTDIALNNPRTYQYSSAIISVLLKFEQDDSQKAELLKKIMSKFKDIPNTGYLGIWLYRIVLGIKSDVHFDNGKFNQKLCNKKVKPADIWNSEWLNDTLKNKIESSSIVDQTEVENLPEIITEDEFGLFNNYNYA